MRALQQRRGIWTGSASSESPQNRHADSQSARCKAQQPLQPTGRPTCLRGQHTREVNKLKRPVGLRGSTDLHCRRVTIHLGLQLLQAAKVSVDGLQQRPSQRCGVLRVLSALFRPTSQLCFAPVSFGTRLSTASQSCPVCFLLSTLLCHTYQHVWAPPRRRDCALHCGKMGKRLRTIAPLRHTPAPCYCKHGLPAHG